MEECRRRIFAGHPEESFIFAKTQTKGRGRQGRVWNSPKGNLYASLILRPRVPSALWHQCGFVAGLALAETIDLIFPQKIPSIEPHLSLKWPNDILLERRKVAGVLLETEGDFLLLGLGVNLVSHPLDTRHPACHLGEWFPAPDPTSLLSCFGSAFRHAYDFWQAQGFSLFRKRWLVQAEGLGKRMQVSLPGEKTLAGIFRGVDPQGALLLQGKDQVCETIHAGEICFTEPPEASLVSRD